MRKKIILGLILIILLISGFENVSSKTKEISLSFDDALIGYWSFNDGSANDSSHKGNHGTIHGTSYRSSGGPGNSGYLIFDGLSDYISINDISDFKFISQDISFSCWVKITDNADAHRCFIGLSGIDDDKPSISLQKSRSGYLDGRIISNAIDSIGSWSHAESIQDGGNLPKNIWLHIVCVIDYPSSNMLYMNGIHQDTYSMFPYDMTETTNLQLYFGAGPWFGGSNYHKGSLDEVKIFDSALTENEILELFQEQFKHYLFIGSISNLDATKNTYISFNAENLGIFDFSKSQFIRYASDENVMVLKTLFGFLNEEYAIGLFKAII